MGGILLIFEDWETGGIDGYYVSSIYLFTFVIIVQKLIDYIATLLVSKPEIEQYVQRFSKIYINKI